MFVLVADVGYCLDVYSNFTGVGDNFVPTKPEKVQPLLDTLTALALLRVTDEGGGLG